MGVETGEPDRVVLAGGVAAAEIPVNEGAEIGRGIGGGIGR